MTCRERYVHPSPISQKTILLVRCQPTHDKYPGRIIFSFTKESSSVIYPFGTGIFEPYGVGRSTFDDRYSCARNSSLIFDGPTLDSTSFDRQQNLTNASICDNYINSFINIYYSSNKSYALDDGILCLFS